MRSVVAVSLVSACLASVGCQSTTPRPVSSSDQKDAAVLATLGSLEGEWQMVGEDGSPQPGSVFAVSSNGSVVREIMFPGVPHEMTNVYHMDGRDIVMTHYCAIGNQPRLVAEEMQASPEGPAFDFRFDSVSNLRPEHDHFMGGLRLTIIDADNIREEWTNINADGTPGETMTFEMRRKR